MAVTKTTHVSYGSRLGNSLKGVVGGFAMLLIGIVLFGMVMGALGIL